MRPPVVIVGAPRSGTNMLRDLVCAVPGVTTWPCDEINPIWRHGNLDVSHDQFSTRHARPQVAAFIRGAFDRRGRGAEQVVEKTCATSLRVGFVDEVVPDARYVLILRDGRDAAPSALKRWCAPTDLSYTLRKARFVPPGDFAHYAVRWLRRRIERVRSSRAHLSTWGPRFPGMDDFLREHGVAATCAAQWSRCVERSVTELRSIDRERWVTVRYESFVTSPESELRRILDFMGVGASVPLPDTSGVVTGGIGKGWGRLDESTRAEMQPHLASGLAHLASFDACGE